MQRDYGMLWSGLVYTNMAIQCFLDAPCQQQSASTTMLGLLIHNQGLTINGRRTPRGFFKGNIQ